MRLRGGIISDVWLPGWVWFLSRLDCDTSAGPVLVLVIILCHRMEDFNRETMRNEGDSDSTGTEGSQENNDTLVIRSTVARMVRWCL